MPRIRLSASTGQLLGLLLCFCALCMRAADVYQPQPFIATYAVTAGGITVGHMTRALQLADDGRYRFTATVATDGLAALLKPTRIEEESSGHWTGAYPTPARYSHHKQSGGKRQETVIEFDWATGHTHATAGGASLDARTEAGELDKLAYQLALMRDLAAGVDELRYRIAEPGGSKLYRLERSPAARVAIDGTTYDTIPVTYARDDGRRTVLWCAAALAYLPVRIEYTEKDGKMTTAELVSTDAP